MKKFFIIVLVIVLLAIVSFVSGNWKRGSTSMPTTMLLQSCPDEKIVNQMPGPGGPKPSYYIKDGVRKEIAEYDAAWVAANCSVPEQVVY